MHDTMSPTASADSALFDNLRLELRRGCLVVAVLAALRTEQYGYTLRKLLAEHGLNVDEGTLYPLLRRLETQGLLLSEWREEAKRNKRFYPLDQGTEILTQLLAEWRSIDHSLNAIVSEPDHGHPRPLLQAVKFFLPRSQQDDIIRELSENLIARMQDREEELRRPLDEVEQAAILREHGHPMLVAGRYRTRQQLIGPTFFPLYLLALNMGVGVALLVSIVLGVVTAALYGDHFGVFSKPRSRFPVAR